MGLIIWNLFLVCSAVAIMDSELHYATPIATISSNSGEKDAMHLFTASPFAPGSNPLASPFLQHFYLKKCSILSSSAYKYGFFGERSHFPSWDVRGRSTTDLRDILLFPPSCEKPPSANAAGAAQHPSSQNKKNNEVITAPSEPIELIKEQTDSKEGQGEAPLKPDSDNNDPEKNPSSDESALNATEVVPKVDNNKTEDIPSFREWTQKALEKEEKERKEVQGKRKQQQQLASEQNSTSDSPSPTSTPDRSSNGSINNASSAATNNNGGSGAGLNPASSSASSAPSQTSLTSSGTRLKKNYASLDCGAKIVGSNPEASGGNYIISPSRDEYMLNKCSDKIWFVLELCESIKARRVEIANFELYSSLPKEIRVSLSNVYHPSSRDWTHFGTFMAGESRGIQVFENLEDNVFGKYVKVEILSHHGSEHYCPISLFKIFGISEIELMAHDEEEDVEQGDHIPQEEEEEVEVVTQGSPKNRGKSSIVNFIKEKVDATIERVVGAVFPSQKDNNGAPPALIGEGGHLNQTPIYTLHCPHCNGTMFQELATIMSTELYSLGQLQDSSQSLRRTLKDFTCRDRFGFPSLGNQNSSDDMLCPLGSSLNELYVSVYGSSRMIALCNMVYYEDKLIKDSKPDSKNGKALVDGTNSSSCEEDAKKKKTTQESGGGAHQKADPSSVPTENPLPSPPSVASNGAQKEEQQRRPTDIQPSKVVEGSDDVVEGSTTLVSSTVKSPGPEPSSATPSSMLDPPSVVHVPPPASSMANNNNGHEDQDSKAAVASSSPNQRESVWQKLTNRIKSLERNVSFSSGYLEELSVQYKKQIEDLQLSVRQSAESLNSALKSILAEKTERKKLEAQIRELSSTLFVLSEKVDSISSWTFGAHLTFIILEIIVGAYCIVSSHKTSSSSTTTPRELRNTSNYSSYSPRLGDSSKKRTGSRVHTSPTQHHEEQNMQISKETSSCNTTEPEYPIENESLPTRGSFCCKRRHSSEERDDGARRNLDFSSFKLDPQYPQALSRRQRRKLAQRRKISSSGSKFKNPKIRLQTLLSGGTLASIDTHNMFQCLDSSVHGDPTPVKQLYCFESNNNNASVLDPSLLGGKGTKSTSTPGAKNFLRSKSTSPTRKSEAARQREDFENFDPDEFRTNNSPLPPAI